jgi:hypothetical protein
MWLREWCLARIQNGEFALVLLFVFLAHLFLVAAVERDRIHKYLPKKASNLYVSSLILLLMGIMCLVIRPFTEPYSYVGGFLLTFTGPTIIFVRAPGYFGFHKYLRWHSHLMAVAYSILCIVYSALIPR